MKVKAARRWLQIKLDRPGAIVASGLHEASGRIYRARCTDGQEQVGPAQRIINGIHLVRHFTEKDDVRPQTWLTTSLASRSWRQRARPAGCFPAVGAKGRSQFAMHVYDPPRPCPLVQIIDILCHDQQLARPLPVQCRQRLMRSIGGYLLQLGAPLIIEAVHQRGIARQCLWRAHIFNAMPFPQAVRTPEGRKPTLGGDACAGQDHDVANIIHGVPHARPIVLRTRSQLADDKACRVWHRTVKIITGSN